MEVKINKEIRQYSETMYFGLSLRQFFFSICSCAVAVGLYFLLDPYFSLETLSWLCILGAFPFALLGFASYHGMNAEQFIWAWLKSEIILPKRFLFVPKNMYFEILKSYLSKKDKERKLNDKNAKRCNKTRSRKV